MLDQIQFKDQSEYESKEGSSINEIILRHIKKISDISSGEFTGGYMEKRPIKVGDTMFIMETYKEDKREAYNNAVDFLVDIVYPLSDKKFKDYMDQIDKEQEPIDIKLKLRLKRQIFKQINIMFERNNFFTSSDSVEE